MHDKSSIYHVGHDLIRALTLYDTEHQLPRNEFQNILLNIEEMYHHYAFLYDLTACGYFTLDKNGTILKVNKAGANFLGIQKEALVDQHLSRYVVAESRNAYLLHKQNALANPVAQTVELKFMRKEGACFYAKLTSKVFTHSITDEKFLLVFLDEISAEKNLPSLNINDNHAEKFASIIVQELNHLLTIHTNYLFGSISRLESGNFKVKEIIDALKKSASLNRRVSDFILRLKNYNYKNNLTYETIKVDTLLNEIIPLIQDETSHYPIDLCYTPRTNLPELFVDKIHIQQVILNLARNSIEAMKIAKTANPKLTIEINQFEVNTLEFSIIDNGPGLRNDEINTVFSSYCNSKIYGIGLGLSLSQSIIESHGGEIYAEKTVFGSTCFKFTLPVKPKQRSS